ncbi:FecR family protein [Thermophagus sp. OGC60D27]|uniref:FecR family protein n=1 Tax=Thermophagus sp. OGC60D27 TaxID=3458415 RepID=UPI004037887D
MGKSENIPTETLVRYFSGEINSEEKFQLEQWRQQSEENEKVFQEFQLIWNAGCRVHLPKDLLESDWQKIRNRISLSSPKKGRVVLLDAFMKVAAIFVVMFLVSAALYTYWNIPGFGRWTAFKTGDYVDSLRLPDNSMVYLNNYSSLKYLKNFGDGKRTVSLDGEGFFDVQSDSENPFRIHTPEGVVVEVLGTSFHLETGSGVENLELNVTKGIVSFSYRHTLKPVAAGNSAFVKDGKVHVEPYSDSNFLSWKTGKLVFKQSSLQNVAKTLLDYYDEIEEVNVNTTSDVEVTTSFSNQSVLAVIEELEILFDKKFLLKEGVLTISD